MASDFVMQDAASDKTFRTVAAILGAFLALGIVSFIVIFFVRQADVANSPIAIQNQTIEAANYLVTQTVMAMTQEAKPATATRPRPTAEPTKIPTFTPSPRPTEAETAAEETPEATEEPSPTAPPPTPTIGPGGGQLPAGGLGMWAAVVSAGALLIVILLARQLRPAV